MKLTMVLLIATMLQARAASYAQTITLKVKNASLEEVFTRIRQQTGYNFL